MENPLILAQDAFTLLIQIQMPHAPPSQPLPPGLQLIPTDILDGLLSSLDNKHTGDVKFVCLEYGGEEDPRPLLAERAGQVDNMTGSGTLRRTRSRSTSGSTIQDISVYRKRILYAHSDILRARSEYFRDLLDFQESTSVPSRLGQRLGSGSGGVGNERKVHTIHCHETDFQTIYWTLHWIYSNELDFAVDDDVREVVKRNHMGSNLKARRLIGGNGTMPLPDEWEWHKSSSGHGGSSVTPSQEGQDADADDVRTMRSGVSASSTGTSLSMSRAAMHSSIQSLRDVAVPTIPVPSREGQAGNRPMTVGAGTSSSSIPKPRSVGGLPSSTRPTSGDNKATLSKPLSRLPVTPATTSRISARMPPSSASPSSSKISPTAGGPTRTYPLHYSSTSPATTRPKDPHSHPTITPAPASSFAIYALAHRYRLTGLQELAQTHLTEKLTPGTACNLLLASYKYEELHAQAQEYVVENWTAIQEEVSELGGKCVLI